MTTFTTIADGEIDVSSPITESVLTRLRDNPIAITEGATGAPKIQTAAIQDGAVTTSKIYDGSVNSNVIATGGIHQSEISVSSGTVSASFYNSNGADYYLKNTLPGGQYGFFVRLKEQNIQIASGNTSHLSYQAIMLAGPGESIIYEGPASLSTTYDSYITFYSLFGGVVSGTGTAQQTYINSSPPYNIGNGDIAHFIYLKIDNTTGDILGTYAADAPPWAYNGPTDIRADIYDKQGKPWRFKKVFQKENDLTNNFDIEQSNIKNCIESRRIINQYKKGVINWAEIQNYIEPVTHDIKNADMGLIPQPMNTEEGTSIVLLNPTSALVDDLALLAEEKVDLSDLLHNGYLTIDNDSVDVAAPPGVKIVNAKWKDTGS